MAGLSELELHFCGGDGGHVCFLQNADVGCVGLSTQLIRRILVYLVVLKFQDGGVAYFALNLFRLKILPSVLYRTGISCGNYMPMRWSMAAMKMANRVGVMMHRCLTLDSTGKSED